MSKTGLPVGKVGGGGTRGKRHSRGSVPVPTSLIAHDLESKARTVDVLNEDNKDRDFSSMMLSESILKGLKDSGFIRPSPIQLAAIPNGKIGLDMIVQSKSGTGKTCVYVVTALEMMRAELPGLQVLVLAPTREIAMQGLQVATQIGSHLPDLKMSGFIGGLPVAEDRIKATRCQMAVGTPGRIKQLLSEGILSADTVRLVILDEADKLLEPSFLAETTAILGLLPQNKQVLALSATYPDELARLAEKFMRSPQHIRLGQESQVLQGVAQFLVGVDQSPVPAKQNQLKQAALLKILSSVPYSQCLIFSNYQVLAQSVADFLNSRGFPAIFISAGQEQSRRLQAMQTFKQFNCRILCSTDLTARGIDAENVNLVVNLDVPWDHNTYLHRIGRGGRFGANSSAISLVAKGKDYKQMQKIVRLTGSVVRILPEIFPKDIRDCELPIVEGAAEENAATDGDEDSPEAASSETADISENNNKTADGDDCKADKSKSGKVKRRGKKSKSKMNTGNNVTFTEQSKSPVVQPVVTDPKLILREHLSQMRPTAALSDILTAEELNTIVDHLGSDQVTAAELQKLGAGYVSEADAHWSEAKSERVGKAILEWTSSHRKQHCDRIEAKVKEFETKSFLEIIDEIEADTCTSTFAPLLNEPGGLSDNGDEEEEEEPIRPEEIIGSKSTSSSPVVSTPSSSLQSSASSSSSLSSEEDDGIKENLSVNRQYLLQSDPSVNPRLTPTVGPQGSQQQLTVVGLNRPAVTGSREAASIYLTWMENVRRERENIEKVEYWSYVNARSANL